MQPMRTICDRYSIVPGRGVCAFDPGTLMIGSMVATAAGGALSASSTLAGGKSAEEAGAAQKAGAYSTAAQIEQNATQAFASGQRKALDTGMKTRLAISTSRARAGASGVDPGFGSPAENEGELAQRGSYHALMDLFNGESEATGLRNQAENVRFSGDLAEIEGQQKRKASKLAALGTLAGTAGSMFSTYGKLKYPTGAKV